MTEPFSRRDFLGTCAAAGGALLACGLAAQPLRAAEEAGWPKLPPVKIHVVYIGLGGAWPKPEFDAKAEMAKFQKYLEGVKQRLGDTGTFGLALVVGVADVDPFILSLLREADMAPAVISTAIILAAMSNTIAKGFYFGTLASSIRRPTAIRYAVWALLHLVFVFI